LGKSSGQGGSTTNEIVGSPRRGDWEGGGKCKNPKKKHVRLGFEKKDFLGMKLSAKITGEVRGSRSCFPPGKCKGRRKAQKR